MWLICETAGIPDRGLGSGVQLMGLPTLVWTLLLHRVGTGTSREAKRRRLRVPGLRGSTGQCRNIQVVAQLLRSLVACGGSGSPPTSPWVSPSTSTIAIERTTQAPFTENGFPRAALSWARHGGD